MMDSKEEFVSKIRIMQKQRKKLENEVTGYVNESIQKRKIREARKNRWYK